MIKKDLVSIIIPVYNAENYIEECLKSIISQTYSNIEIIIINDGSSDHSESICKKYNDIDNRIKLISIENKGVSDARNLGINNSKGKYLTFIDSDDIIAPDYIELLIKDTDSNCLNICKYLTFSDTFTYDTTDYTTITISKKEFINLYEMKLFNTPCCKLYNKKIINDNNILFDTKLSIGEDLLFNLKYYDKINEVKVIDKKLYFYRYHGAGTLSTKYTKDMKKIQFMLINELDNFFIEIKPNKNLNKLIMERITTIIENEFNNKNVGFLKRYFNSIKILNNKEIQNKISKYHRGYSNVYYILLKMRFFITYKVFYKILNYIH